MRCEIGKSDDFPVGRPVPRVAAEQKLVVVRTEQGLFAMENECPHQSQALDTGTVVGDTLKCRNHGVSMDLRSGEIVEDGGYLGLLAAKTFAIEERDGRVFVEV